MKKKETRTEHVATRIEPEVKQCLARFAEGRAQTLSDALRTAVFQYMCAGESERRAISRRADALEYAFRQGFSLPADIIRWSEGDDLSQAISIAAYLATLEARKGELEGDESEEIKGQADRYRRRLQHLEAKARQAKLHHEIDSRRPRLDDDLEG